MAGSYNHCVNNDGKWDGLDGVSDMMDTGGDLLEAVEEMFGMIWVLAGGSKTAVELARQNWQDGFTLHSAAMGEHKESPDDMTPEQEEADFQNLRREQSVLLANELMCEIMRHIRPKAIPEVCVLLLKTMDLGTVGNSTRWDTITPRSPDYVELLGALNNAKLGVELLLVDAMRHPRKENHPSGTSEEKETTD